jgi:HAD superfamily hydrolase (TIGR01509 family)
MSGMVELVRDHGVPIRPGARELLAEVVAAGLPHALVTSSEREFMDAVLARTGLSFDALVCAEDVSVTKPDPEPYLLAAKLLGADPARCVALEDSPNGVASAEAAGYRVIAVPSLVPIEPAPGRTVVRSLLDLRADASGISLRESGVSPSARHAGDDLDSDMSHGEVRACPPTTRSPGCRCAAD